MKSLWLLVRVVDRDADDLARSLVSQPERTGQAVRRGARGVVAGVPVHVPRDRDGRMPEQIGNGLDVPPDSSHATAAPRPALRATSHACRCSFLEFTGSSRSPLGDLRILSCIKHWCAVLGLNQSAVIAALGITAHRWSGTGPAGPRPPTPARRRRRAVHPQRHRGVLAEPLGRRRHRGPVRSPRSAQRHWMSPCSAEHLFIVSRQCPKTGANRLDRTTQIGQTQRADLDVLDAIEH